MLTARPHDVFMEMALEEARQAAREEEVPVGAVAVLGDEVIARDHNRREQCSDPTAHAEVLALREASRKLGRWRLTDVRLYVTMEPCTLCAGAVVLARIPVLIFGCEDPKAGACGSLYSVVQDPRLNHRVEVVQGVRAESARDLLRAFFGGRRRKGQPPFPRVPMEAPCTALQG